ncbi:MAG: hypothetical protein A3F67_02965 [Verrucomicrobia bacterium RIFCSPHIGHO2_12_FULL_41_10]|nr:MAG: hypothetical protein A3F67_02965 [Verrucomicrobia bacterium RIFCSPHIGHO2_12_FULL_41_10]
MSAISSVQNSGSSPKEEIEPHVQDLRFASATIQRVNDSLKSKCATLLAQDPDLAARIQELKSKKK